MVHQCSVCIELLPCSNRCGIDLAVEVYNPLLNREFSAQNNILTPRGLRTRKRTCVGNFVFGLISPHFDWLDCPTMFSD